MERIRSLLSRPSLWLSLGLVLFLFSHGIVTIPVCSWFAFVFLIRFHRTSQRPGLAIGTLWLGMSACHVFMYDGILPISGLLYYVACFAFGGVWVLPFTVDWLLYRRLRGLASTFLWPVLMVTINYFMAPYLPSLAHSQVEFLSLIQIVSVTGMGGLIFLIYWFAGALNRVWESGFELSLARREGSIFLSALIVILVFGDVRLASATSQGETLQVAMVNPQRNRLETLDDFKPDTVGRLFALSRKAVSADAKVIAWSEANADIPSDYEDDLLELGKEFAKNNGVHLFMSFRSFSTPSRNENKTVGISPRGDIIVDYLKSNPIPFLEAGTEKGHGEIATADIDGVRTAHAICYDLDFPSFIQQVGKHDVDILFAPSSDWREVRFLHAASARFRAIENGCSLVRPTIQGLSIATDPYGRVLSYHDYYANTPRLSIVGVPSRGVKTVYGTFGDVFSIACIFLFVGVCASAYFKRNPPCKA